jgi:membrane-associated protease RseP (regulator of RpoE activity)
MAWRTVIATGAAFVAGTVAHELTHWLVAHLLGADVERVSLISAAPQVVYRAPTPGVDVAVRGSTVPVAALVLVAVGLAGTGRSPRVQLVLAAFALGYLPRSGSDWSAVETVVTSWR